MLFRSGEDGKDADSIKITQDENNVYFELADGTVITISKTGQSADPNVIYLCKILSTIYCTPTTPPTGLDNYTFETTCKIYVPLSAVSSYKYRESWSKYASQIEGYDFE